MSYLGSDEEIMVQDKVSDNYENIRYLKEYSTFYQDFLFESMLSLIDKKGLIFDNGCGVGNIVKFLNKDDVIGLDISKGMLNHAKNRMNIVLNGDSQRLPFKDGIFDVVVCRSLLHHLPEPKKGVFEMSRVLKKGGEIVILETVQSILSNIPRKIVSRGEHFSDLHQNFEKNELIAILNDEFTIELKIHIGYIAYPILGFPDVIDFLKYLPFKNSITSSLIYIDKLISTIPIINTQSWGIIIKAQKK